MLTPSQNRALRPSRSARKASTRLHDKQSERDHRELRIDKVGVRGLRFPIQIRDKAHALQNTVATIGLFVNLPKEFKGTHIDRKSTRLNSSHTVISYAVFCLKKKKKNTIR